MRFLKKVGCLCIALTASPFVLAEGNGAVHTLEPVATSGCQDMGGGLEYCWEDEGFVTAIYTPSGNVIGKATTITRGVTTYGDIEIQVITEVYERQGIFKNGEPFTWKSDRVAEVCNSNPYTGESHITTWTYRYANGTFRRQDIEIAIGEC